ncbi:uncharacterized protein F5891DRAFT_978931 [Suillus fuscotomentosus]|uniref:Uncharacterized protein n=1 Tax=Suillus fuscotomentosus TaxID=1912939 RepID=A0AAD4E9S6_9AGAM|nr:uncharacterized protein F5891DRAFT_978931 [Suillus fuscotomentosus]KAG1902226.1 hypothetical protein F5891DRAFT_978931 [Suillus fuscotomentosus]
MTGTPEPNDVHSSDDEASFAELQHKMPLDPLQAILMSSKARAKCRIAALEEELETMRQERGGKQRKTTFYVSQGRAIRRLAVLYHSLEDLIAENNRRYEFHSSLETTSDNSTTQARSFAAWLY